MYSSKEEKFIDVNTLQEEFENKNTSIISNKNENK